MRLIPILLAGCALAACSSKPIDNAAVPANADIDIHDNLTVEDSSQAPPAPGEPGGLANDTTPVSEAPLTQESAQAAANVVQTYYALIEARKYRQAWALWSEGGKASGMTADGFGATFGKFAEYHANIGAPGQIDAGAGQRYVTVPVQTYGRMKDGRPFNMLGSMTLHRVGDVPGATPEQLQWRIRSAELVARPSAPEPSPTPTEDNRSVARYRCTDGSKLTARFDPDKGKVTIEPDKGATHELTRQGTSTGIRYASDGYSFGGRGETMTYAAPGATVTVCNAIR